MIILFEAVVSDWPNLLKLKEKNINIIIITMDRQNFTQFFNEHGKISVFIFFSCVFGSMRVKKEKLYAIILKNIPWILTSKNFPFYLFERLRTSTGAGLRGRRTTTTARKVKPTRCYLWHYARIWTRARATITSVARACYCVALFSLCMFVQVVSLIGNMFR